jgi:hypothetical protein
MVTFEEGELATLLVIAAAETDGVLIISLVYVGVKPGVLTQ